MQGQLQSNLEQHGHLASMLFHPNALLLCHCAVSSHHTLAISHQTLLLLFAPGTCHILASAQNCTKLYVTNTLHIPASY